MARHFNTGFSGRGTSPPGRLNDNNNVSAMSLHIIANLIVPPGLGISAIKPELRNGNGGRFKAGRHSHAVQSGAQAHAIQKRARDLVRPGQRESLDCVRFIAALSHSFLTRSAAKTLHDCPPASEFGLTLALKCQAIASRRSATAKRLLPPSSIPTEFRNKSLQVRIQCAQV